MAKKRDYIPNVHPQRLKNFGLSTLKYALNLVGKEGGFVYINAVIVVTNGIQLI